jgi:hypothetical protein
LIGSWLVDLICRGVFDMHLQKIASHHCC